MTAGVEGKIKGQEDGEVEGRVGVGEEQILEERKRKRRLKMGELR